MFRHTRRTLLSALATVALVPVTAAGQAPGAAADDAPAIRQWLDVQALQVGGRYRWNENSNGAETADGLQWHALTRGRVLFEPSGRLALNIMASAGPTYVASWNDTGIGRGDFVGRFSVRHLFLAAELVRGLELQVGGLAPNRGDVSENLSHDMDGYLVGQRATVRPSTGRITQVSGTVGHLGDFAEPNVFRRLDDFVDYNYGQLLVGVRLHARATASVDYAYEDGRHVFRQAVVLRAPAAARAWTGVRLEAYERASNIERVGSDVLTGTEGGWGVNASADFRFGKLTVTAGVMSVDRAYLPTFNGDRYGIGKRWYSIGTYSVTPSASLIWYHTRAFGNDFFVPVNHRFDVILVINPTAALKRAGVF